MSEHRDDDTVSSSIQKEKDIKPLKKKPPEIFDFIFSAYILNVFN